MQNMDAENLGKPIGFLDPTRICQTQHTVRLAPGSDQLKGKTPKEIAEYKKGLHKEKLITVAQYIGRAFLHFQNKSHHGCVQLQVSQVYFIVHTCVISYVTNCIAIM
jgi:hypothetical protein